MKKILILLMLFSNPCFAGTITLTYPDGQQAEILEGLTKNGKACNEGEALGVCAKRLIVKFVKEEIKNYEDQRDRNAISNSERDIS